MTVANFKVRSQMSNLLNERNESYKSYQKGYLNLLSPKVMTLPTSFMELLILHQIGTRDFVEQFLTVC